MGVIRSLHARFQRWLVEGGVAVEYRGIKLCQLIAGGGCPDEFVFWTKLALDLVESADPRRMARIQRELDYIVDTELSSLASYTAGRICNVDFTKFEVARQPEWLLPMYASSIIHEATHGTLYARGLPYTKRNRLRIERICRAEENRFLSQVSTRWGENLRRPFDPGDWKRKSRVARARSLWRSIQANRTKASRSWGARARLEILGAEASNGVFLATVRALFDEQPKLYRFRLGVEGYEALGRLLDVSVSRPVGSGPDRFLFIGALPNPLNAGNQKAAVRVVRGDTSHLVAVRMPLDLIEHLSWFAELRDPGLAAEWEVDNA
ncbi:MAG: hypothetical protein M9921_07065 [Fimbriimonadaceae bacterium]|nr:hypothetical protein [Chthonomonadaceae bacterium]MCO5296599.1 hypothetical protein [Fimbriimonadaceae bacterium]